MLNRTKASGLFFRNRIKKYAGQFHLPKLFLFVCICGLSLSAINCGGGGGASSSNSNLAPLISSFSPSIAFAGGSTFTLTITGSNFTSSMVSSGCSVRWNGVPHATAFVNSTTLTFPVLATDIAVAGSFPITVLCNGKLSNSINYPVDNPVPELSSFTPSYSTAGSNSFTLTLNGSNFNQSSSVRWNAINKPSTFVSSKALTISIMPSEVSTAGSPMVGVINPMPGGGQSSLRFTIRALQPLVFSTKILPDAVHNKAYHYSLLADGGIPPYFWSIASGSLPSGLSLVSGEISGTPPVVANNTNYNLEFSLTDSALQASSAAQNLNLLVRSGSLGRNESCANATPIVNGTIRASISPVGDIDVFSFQGTQNSQVAINIDSQRITDSTSQLDSFLEILDSRCAVLTYNDDDPSDSDAWDSKISSYTLPSTGTFYIRVSSVRGDGRPDFNYNLSLSGAN